MVLVTILVDGLSSADAALGAGVIEVSPESAYRQENSDRKRMRASLCIRTGQDRPKSCAERGVVVY